MRKYLVITLAALMLSVPGLHRALAQTLDDAIDAELDDVSAGLNSPSTAPKSGDMDDIQLDDGGSTPPQTAQAPETTPAPQAPAADDGLDQALVDDELKIDDEAPATAQAPQNPQDDLSVEFDEGGGPSPQDVAKPSDEMPDLDIEDGGETSAPQFVDSQPSSEPAPQQQEPAPEIEPAPPKVASSVSIDGGNAAIEKRLAGYARGYKQVPDMNWDEIVGERRQESYRLQRGDTLWDISETFFGDGFFWAKLWSQNGVIGNPHNILRGNGIRFVAGTEADAPAIAVVDRNSNISTNPLSDGQFEAPTYREQIQGEVTPEEIESGVVLETDELIPAPELPPPDKRASPLKQLPASFAETKIDVQAAGYDASGIKGAPPIQANIAPSLFLNSMILDGKPNDIGKVEEIETQERVAGTGQSVFVTARKELPIGSRVTFIRRRDRPSGASGPVVDIEGVGVVDGVIKDSSNTYRVTITTSLFPIEKGSLVIEEPPPRLTMARNGRHSDVQVKVVGGEFDDARKLLGTPSVVYLNGGSSAGLRKGDILAVGARRGSRRETKFPDLMRPIALIKIADVREKVATAAVLTSSDGIAVGDVTGGDWPEDLPSLRAETASESASKFGRTEPVDIE